MIQLGLWLFYNTGLAPLEGLSLRIPDEMSEKQDIYNRGDCTLPCTANITPKYTFVELHVGTSFENTLDDAANVLQQTSVCMQEGKFKRLEHDLHGNQKEFHSGYDTTGPERVASRWWS